MCVLKKRRFKTHKTLLKRTTFNILIPNYKCSNLIQYFFLNRTILSFPSRRSLCYKMGITNNS